MDFGVIFLPNNETSKDVAFAENKGFTHAWVGDSQMVWADAFQCLALSTITTKTIKLGTNVTNPSARLCSPPGSALWVRVGLVLFGGGGLSTHPL